jgi:tetratricopeptide (TPR) repeat protein
MAAFAKAAKPATFGKGQPDRPQGGKAIDQEPFERTLDDGGLGELPDIEALSEPWGAYLPAELGAALTSLAQLDPLAAEQALLPFVDDHGDAPEIWWGLAVAMVVQGDLSNASTCYENFRDRVEIEVALALRSCSADPPAARDRLFRLVPSLIRCRDAPLAIRGLIMTSGLMLLFARSEEAAPLLREAWRRLRSTWPRPWGLMADWLATVAVATASRLEGRRPERSLRLALRLAQHEPGNRERLAAIARDLGYMLNRSDRVADAERVYASAMASAKAGASAEMRASIAIAQAENFQSQRRYLEALGCLDMAFAVDLTARVRALALLASANLMSRLGSAHRDRRQLQEALRAADEAAALLARDGLDPAPALRDSGIAEALLGNSEAAIRSFFALLRRQEPHRLAPGERVALAYLPYLIRMSQGAPSKALRWAELRVRISAMARLDRPRDMLLLREHCIAAAERVGDIATVRRHAGEMLDVEATMLRTALGDGRGPADWNRLRVAREALSILAAMEARSPEPGAGWRRAEALLAGRGLARAARRSLRTGAIASTGASVHDVAARLARGEALLGLVSLHPPAPVDPAFPWASGFLPPRLLAVLITGLDRELLVEDLGDFAECVRAARRWSNDLAVGRPAKTPEWLRPVEAWLAGAEAVYVVAEGALELVPIGLLAPEAVVRHISGVRTQRDTGDASTPLIVVAPDMLDEPFAAATRREIAWARAALGDARLHISASGSLETAALLAQTPRHLHIIAHGNMVADPHATGLDVYQGAAMELGPDLFTASQVADLKLEGIELVILSSCDTAAGVAQHAEGLASMAAAFLDAGAAAVIATLWPVPHVETAAFMALLYEEDLGEPAIALATARRRAQAQGLGRSCWAAWVLHKTGPGA